MNNLIDTALFKARAATQRAISHRAYADMFQVAGMPTLASKRRALAASEEHMTRVWQGIADALA